MLNLRRYHASFVRSWGVWSSTVLGLVLALVAPHVLAADALPSSIAVLGVIASASPTGDGVALIRVGSSAQTTAIRVGDEIDGGIRVQSIARDYVHLAMKGRVEGIRVGETVDPQSIASAPQPRVDGPIEIDRKGDQVTISATMREHLVRHQLSTILMQAAAVPYYEGKSLKGFRLLEIDRGSVFDLAGFRDGDIVTMINAQPLSDVGMAIRVLHALREEAFAEVHYLRDGVEKRLEIKVY